MDFLYISAYKTKKRDKRQIDVKIRLDGFSINIDFVKTNKG